MSSQTTIVLPDSVRRVPTDAHYDRRRWGRAAIISSCILASYLVVYFGVRTGHQSPDGYRIIYTGSRLSNQIFAPLIYLEKSICDRPVADPSVTLQSFLDKSRSTKRPILVALGTRSCLPCRQLEQFLEDQRSIVDKYFVVMKSDLGNERSLGALVSAKYRKRVDTAGYTEYFPWIAFLNESGELLVAGDDRGKNLIGIPQGGPHDQAWFLQMLRTANPAITDAEIDQLAAAAAAYHKLIWSNLDGAEPQKRP